MSHISLIRSMSTCLESCGCFFRVVCGDVDSNDAGWGGCGGWLCEAFVVVHVVGVLDTGAFLPSSSPGTIVDLVWREQRDPRVFMSGVVMLNEGCHPCACLFQGSEPGLVDIMTCP